MNVAIITQTLTGHGRAHVRMDSNWHGVIVVEGRVDVHSLQMQTVVAVESDRLRISVILFKYITPTMKGLEQTLERICASIIFWSIEFFIAMD